jgi:charged multivesicular body protein 2A
MGQGKSKMTPEEQMRAHKRAINRSIRELDRERQNLQNQEAKAIREIKQAAQKGQIASVKTMAKDLVRTRKHMSKFYAMRSQLQGVQLRLQQIKSTEAMARALKGCTQAMSTMQKTMDLPELSKILDDFKKESETLGIQEDLMNETIDEALADDDDEEQEDMIVGQVLDEIGVDLNALLAGAPTETVGGKAAVAAAAPEEDTLESRLAALKK